MQNLVKSKDCQCSEINGSIIEENMYCNILVYHSNCEANFKGVQSYTRHKIILCTAGLGYTID